MADDTGTQNENVDEPQGTQDEPTDWEAKYKEAVAQSRKWEDRAKASFADSEELKKLKEAQMSDAEKTAKRIAELEQENAGYKAAQQQEQWRAQVAKKTGVPADVLRGTSLEEIEAHAASLEPLLHPNPKLPHVSDPAKQPSGRTADEEAKAWVSRLFGEDK